MFSRYNEIQIQMNGYGNKMQDQNLKQKLKKELHLTHLKGLVSIGELVEIYMNFLLFIFNTLKVKRYGQIVIIGD